MSASGEPWQVMAVRLLGQTPWFAALGGEFLAAGDGHAEGRIAWRADLVGDPESGAVHGGVITALLDQLGGAAVMSKLIRPMPIATLDLRIDYLKPTPRGADVEGAVQCLKVTHDVAFVRGAAWCGTRDNQVALCSGAFILMGAGAGVSAPPPAGG